jgi:DNA-binding CsgD family transcriptional regulator
VVIEGPAGIGKTSLLRAVRALGHQTGMQVLDGRGSELEGDFAFGVMRQALERPLAALDEAERSAVISGQAAHAGPLFVAGQPVAGIEALLQGLYWLIANLAERTPVLLAIDDVHWADGPSVAALAFLAGRLAQLPVALIVSTRPPDLEATKELTALVTDPAAERLVPEPLSADAVAALGGTNDAAFARMALRTTGGNPFLVDELLRELGPERSAAAVERVEPRDLGRIVLARISAEARALAWALAVLGERATLAECGVLADVPDAPTAADELMSSGIIADAQELRFRHPLIGAAVAAGLPRSRRADWHARAAALLRDTGAGPERLAVHLAAAEPSGSCEVVDVLLEAAQRSLDRGASASAPPLLRRALDESPDAQRRGRVLLALGEALAATGEDDADAAFADAAVASEDPLVQARALEGRARVGWARSADSVAADLADIDRFLTALPRDSDDVRLRVEAARLAVAQRSPGAMSEAVARAGAIGLLDESRPQHPDVLAHVALWSMHTGHSAAECVPVALRSLDAADGRYRAIPPGLWFPFTGMVLQAAERLAELRASTRAMQRATQEGGSPTWYAATTQSYARILRDGGDLLAAEEEARLAVDASQASDEPWMQALPLRTLVSVLLDRGAVEEAARTWSLLGLSDIVPDSRPMSELLVTRARLRERRGNGTGAIADLREAARRLDRSESLAINEQDIRLHLALLEHATGDQGAADTIAARARVIAERWGTPGAIGSALRVSGVISADVEMLRAAVAHLETSALRLEHARASADLGAALRRQGDRRDARDPLRAALGLARECGADGLAARAAAELAATGEHVSPRARDGTDALTPSERRITRLAADGLSNKDIAQALFLSIKTIEMHLRNSYRKLDITSRQELKSTLPPSP